jgi:uncharacterized protein YdeI (YjbR/CyaY-like superfamily)
MLPSDRFPQVEVRSVAQWRDWLLAHHGQEESIWLVTWKKHAGATHVGRWDAMDEALCFGWVDGIMRRIDDDRVMQLFSPRRHQRWTAMYRDRVARLVEEGRMQPAGLRAVEAAKTAGTWEAMPEVDALEVPEDLDAALGGLRAAFDALPPSYRRNLLRWVALAKRTETRGKRLAAIVAATAEGRRIPQM